MSQIGGVSKFYNFFGKNGLAGGLNVSDDPLIVGPNEMVTAENIMIGRSLGRQKRPGLENYHTSSFAGTSSYPNLTDPIRGIIQYWRYGSSTGIPTEDLFLHQSTKVWSIASRTSPGIDRTDALTIATDGVPSYQVFEGVLFFLTSDTADGYLKWNGTPSTPGNAESAIDPPDGPGKYLGIFKSRMLMAGNPDFPFRVYMSASLDAEDWTSDDALSFDLDYDGDPDGVTAIFPELDGRVFIATRRSIYELTGNDIGDFVVNRITRGVGCVGSRTVAATPNDILFASDRGVHSLKKVIVSDQTEIGFQSDKIQTLWVDLLTAQLLSQAQAAWDEMQNIYVITVPSSGQNTNDIVLAFNITYGYWVVWTDIDARSLSTVLINNKQYILAGREDGKIAFLNPSISTDFDEGFTAHFKSGKFFPQSDITTQFRFKSLTVLASTTRPSTVSIGWSIDAMDGTRTGSKAVNFGTEQALLGTTFILGASRLGIGRFIPKKITIEDTGFNFQLEIISGGDSDFKFLGWILEVEDADEFVS